MIKSVRQIDGDKVWRIAELLPLIVEQGKDFTKTFGYSNHIHAQWSWKNEVSFIQTEPENYYEVYSLKEFEIRQIEQLVLDLHVLEC